MKTVDRATVAQLKIIWRATVIEYVEAHLDQVYKALVKAKDLDDIRVLQGKANALQALLRFPEDLEARLLDEEREVPQISG